MHRLHPHRPTRNAAPAAIRCAAALTVSESLEGRRLLSTITQTDLDADGNLDLRIDGTSGADHVFIWLDQEANNRVIVIDDRDRDWVVDSGEFSQYPLPRVDHHRHPRGQ